jgi:dGTP triphosphohydrolase
MKDKKRIINDLNEVIELVANTKDLEIEIEKVSEEIAVVVELATKAIKDNSKTTDDSNEFEQKYKALETRHEKLKTKLEELLSERFKKESLEIKMRAFLKALRKSESEIDKWDERIWMLMVESGTVHRNKNITFKFNNGLNFKAKE